MFEISAPNAGSLARLANNRFVASRAAKAIRRGGRPSLIEATAGARHWLISAPRCENGLPVEIAKGGKEVTPSEVVEFPLTS